MKTNFYWILLLLTNCSNECIENIEFKDKYFNTIETVKIYYIEGSKLQSRSVNDLNFAKSINTLYKITGIKDNVKMDIRFGYVDSSSFRKDVENWYVWYEKNKCNNLNWETYQNNP